METTIVIYEATNNMKCAKFRSVRATGTPLDAS